MKKKAEASTWLPVIDLSLLTQGDLAQDRLAAQLDWACREFGWQAANPHEPGRTRLAPLFRSGR
jgi:isopenicillin N synthase-like dioxygenase